MVLVSVDLWYIIHGSEKAPHSNADPKVLKEYQRRAKKAMSIIGLNLVVNQTYAHRELQRTRGGMEDYLQHPQDEEFVQHPLRMLQVIYV